MGKNSFPCWRWLAALAFAGLLLGAGLGAWNRASRLSAAVSNFAGRQIPLSIDLGELYLACLAGRANIQQLFALRNVSASNARHIEQALSAHSSWLGRADSLVQKFPASLEQEGAPADVRRQFAALALAYGRWRAHFAAFEPVIAALGRASQAGDAKRFKMEQQALDSLYGGFPERAAALADAIRLFRSKQLAYAERDVQTALQKVASILLHALAGGAAAVSLGVLLGFSLGRRARQAGRHKNPARAGAPCQPAFAGCRQGAGWSARSTDAA
jgi:hypothetical protein